MGSASCIGGGDPRRRPPGTRYRRYRCSLPGLAGFTVDRRGGTDAGHHGPQTTPERALTTPREKVAERVSDDKADATRRT